MTPAAGGPRVALGFTAYLRVFEPLSALTPGERERWESWLVRRREAPQPWDLTEQLVTAARREHVSAVSMAVSSQLEVSDDEALVIEMDGVTYLCPLETQRRVWESLATWRESMAPGWTPSFIPDEAMSTALDSFDRSRGMLNTATRIRTSTWHVPLAWFLLVDPGERELILGAGPQDPLRSLRWTTSMAYARRRAAQSLKLLQRTIPEAPTVDALEQTARWLEEFHPHSKVQLDFGDLVSQLDDDFLVSESSVQDLAEGLHALDRGDGATAAQAYERVVRRWQPVQSRESSS